MPEARLVTDEDLTGAEGVPARATCSAGGVIHFPVVVCTSSPSTMQADECRGLSAITIDFVDCVNGLQRAIRISLSGVNGR